MMPVNPEAIGIFGLIATVVCFGLGTVNSFAQISSDILAEV